MPLAMSNLDLVEPAPNLPTPLCMRASILSKSACAAFFFSFSDTV